MPNEPAEALRDEKLPGLMHPCLLRIRTAACSARMQCVHVTPSQAQEPVCTVAAGLNAWPTGIQHGQLCPRAHLEYRFLHCEGRAAPDDAPQLRGRILGQLRVDQLRCLNHCKQRSTTTSCMVCCRLRWAEHRTLHCLPRHILKIVLLSLLL